jgi:hypothetical protein
MVGCREDGMLGYRVKKLPRELAARKPKRFEKY